MMQGQIKREIQLGRYSICALAVYVAFSFVFSDFSVSAILGALVLCAWCGIVAIQLLTLIRRGDWHFHIRDVVVIVFLGVVAVNILRTGSLNRTVAYYGVVLCLSMMLYIFSDDVPKNAICFAKIILIVVASLFSIVNILYVFFPATVRNLIFTIISPTSIAYNERIFAEGYGIAFGEDIGYTAVLNTVGIAALFISAPKYKLKWRVPMLVLQFLMMFSLTALQRRGEMLVGSTALLVTAIIMCATTKSKSWTSGVKRSVYRTVLIELLCVTAAFCSFLAISKDNRIIDMEATVAEIADQTIEMPTNEGPMQTTTPLSEIEPAVGASLTEGTQYSVNTEEKSEISEKIEVLGNGRVILWKMAWDAFLEKPIWGHGWGYFATIAPKSGNTLVTNAHCVYLQLLCETGIIGFVIIGGIFLAFFITAIDAVIRAASMETAVNALMGFFLITFMLGDGLVDNSLYYPYWIILLAIALILLDKTKEKNNEKNNACIWH